MFDAIIYEATHGRTLTIKWPPVPQPCYRPWMWMFVYCVCLQSKQEISWSLLTRHTLFSNLYFYLVAGMKNITSL